MDDTPGYPATSSSSSQPSFSSLTQSSIASSPDSPVDMNSSSSNGPESSSRSDFISGPEQYFSDLGAGVHNDDNNNNNNNENTSDHLSQGLNAVTPSENSQLFVSLPTTKDGFPFDDHSKELQEVVGAASVTAEGHGRMAFGSLSLVDSDEYDEDEEQQGENESNKNIDNDYHDSSNNNNNKIDEVNKIESMAQVERPGEIVDTTAVSAAGSSRIEPVLVTMNEPLHSPVPVSTGSRFAAGTIVTTPPSSSSQSMPPQIGTGDQQEPTELTQILGIAPPFSPKHGNERTSGVNATLSLAPVEAATVNSGSSDSTKNAGTRNISGPAANNNNNSGTTSHGKRSDEEYDVARKAAVQLAAVAAAATANHKSPALAAREARLVAQSLMEQSDAEQTAADMATTAREWKTVKYNELLEVLQTRQEQQRPSDAESVMTAEDPKATKSYPTTLWNVLCSGGNKTFLQHLCLLEHVRCIDTEPDDARLHESPLSPVPPPMPVPTLVPLPLVPVSHADLVDIAERLLALVKKIEGAYDSLLNFLPHVQQSQQSNHGKQSLASASAAQLEEDHLDSTSYDESDMETPVVVPDLLPPCTTKQGDATLAFFRACVGHEEATIAAQSRAARGSTVSMDGLKAGTADTAAATAPPASGDGSTAAYSADGSSKQQQQQQSTLFTMLKKHSGLSVFRKSIRGGKDEGSSIATGVSGAGGSITSESIHHDDFSNSSGGAGYEDDEDCYPVRIEREMLGLTVENVLERTVVRTVLASGPAKKAGAKVGSLIVRVGNIETKNLTHFETIDELRQSQRPLQLIMKQISDDALRAAREEMGRLIKGSGFGAIMDGYNNNNRPPPESMEADGRPLIGADLRIDAYTNMIKRRFSEVSTARTKKEEALVRSGEKLVWILTLFAVGLQREACRLYSLAQTSGEASTPRRHRHSLYSHTGSDYEDAAKSVSKVLMDYARKNVDPQMRANKAQGAQSTGADSHGPIRRRKGPPPPPPPIMPGRGGRGSVALTAIKGDNGSSERPLMQIGDVLQRTRTFLADTTSPPAALLRGELIALLCDILDVDTDMELAEEESASAVVGGGGAKAGMIMDLGSAGSLLKLIVLNCSIMRSPGCEDASQRQERLDLDIEEELRRRFGHREKFTSSDLHKLHAGNRFLSVVHRLAASRSTSARIAACSLGPVLWGHLDFPHQLQLRGVITRALHDPEVIVRKSTATVLHEIAELVFDRRSVPWLVLMCERAMTDPEPQLRSAAMTLTWHLTEHLPNAFLGDASKGSRYLRRLPNRDDPIFADVYLLQCKILPVATRLAEDRSPSVRLAVAAQCDRLCDALGDHWSSVIIDVLLALLSDSDDRVRCEAVSCVPRLAEIVLLSVQPGAVAVSEVSILEALVPASMKLQKDSSPSVRVALATAAGELLALLVTLQSRIEQSAAGNFPDSDRSDHEGIKKYKRQVDDRLIPLVQALLNDKDPEVTSAALRAVTNATRSSASQARHRHASMASEDDSASFSSFHSQLSDMKAPVITPVLSEKQVLRLLPTLTELANSRQWRVRQSAVEIVPALLGCTQQLETRTEISKLCVRLMSDQVDAVRKASAECLCMGAGSLGSHGEGASAEWMTSIVIPAIRKSAVHAQSKQRLLSLKMIETILANGACPAKWKDDIKDLDRLADTPMRELVSIALSLTGDRIANVRLNVGRVLGSVINVFEDEELSFIKEVLSQQIEEERARECGGDADVLYFGQRCVNRAKSILEDRFLQQEDSILAQLPHEESN